ncbi:MAG: V-type ATP synthase subunit I [Anaerolineaceae bacterium]|nr:MAG: V-type ATP synthase subunit I [Anaerolineaceae bacterium]
MALLQMQRIYIYALKKDRKQILELLQRRGVVEVRSMLKEDKVFSKSDVSVAKQNLEKNISITCDSLSILNNYIKEDKSILSALAGRKELPVEEYDSFKEKYKPTVNMAKRIIELSKIIAENKAEVFRLQTQIEILTPWVNLDIPLNFKGTKFTRGFIGTLPKPWTLEEIYEKLAQYMPLDVDIISTTKEQTCIFVLCTNDKKDKVYEVLRGMEFTLPSLSIDQLPTADLSPAEQLELLVQQIDKTKSNIQAAIDEMESYDKNRNELKFLLDYDTMRLEKYEVIGSLIQSKNVFIISGFIAEKDFSAIEEELTSKFDLAVESAEPRKRDDIPVLYKNNGFSEPLEGTVNSFSPPAKGEMDPTMVMSLFYYALFGLMLSDAGYGFLIAVTCAFGLIKFRKTIEKPMKNTLKMYMFCGIATVFWGIIFSSYFGDIFDVVGKTFFGVTDLPVIPPVWFYPVEKPMLMLTFSMAIGIVHLLTGLAMKGYQLAKQKDYKGIIYDVIFWYVLLISGIVLLLSMKMVTDILGITVNISDVAVDVAGILFGASAVAIILTNGRESKQPFKRILKGLYALYGISGYLSDILSYSRLLALGLATGVIGSVINQMASMTAGGFFGPIIFTIIVILGHALNLGINALGAYVHTNRLQYVEFFGKFYEGGGKVFKPFGINTKYYKIKESTKYGNVK